MNITRETIIEDLTTIGIKKGSTVLVTADLLNIGFFVKNKRTTIEEWIDILLECVGEEGTIIVVAFTRSFPLYKKNKEVIFHRNTQSTSGDLANGIIKDKRAFRSTHPTNSIVAIGKNASEITNNHNINTSAFSFLGDIIKLKGKFLMLGSVDKKNAPQAMHYAQECLGQTKRRFISPFTPCSYYIDQNNGVCLYIRTDLGACSKGGYKLLGDLIVNNTITFGQVGNGLSAFMDSEKSFSVIFEALKGNPKLVKCEDLTCKSCFGTFRNNGLGVVRFYLKKLIRNLFINKKK